MLSFQIFICSQVPPQTSLDVMILFTDLLALIGEVGDPAALLLQQLLLGPNLRR